MNLHSRFEFNKLSSVMGKRRGKEKNLRRRRLLSISSDSEESEQYQLNIPNPRYCSPKTKNQGLFLDSIRSSNTQIIVCQGSAGTGKTLISCQEGVRSLLCQDIDRIIITRPAVCADEDIGFLPGDLDDKMKPFTQPLYDNFEKILSNSYVESMIKKELIQIVPLAYMRGRTFEDKFIIADEMQNASIEQMVMLMTRIGKGSKLIIIGDPTQCDRKMKSNGLADLVNRIKNSSNELNHIKLITLENKDIQREAVVREVINKIYNDMPNRR